MAPRIGMATPGSGTCLAWMLATLIHNTGVMLAAWGATVSLVLLVVLLVRRHPSRQDGSSNTTTAKVVLTGPASGGPVSTGTAPTGTAPTGTALTGAGAAATGQLATPGVPQTPARIDGKGEGARDGATSPSGPEDTATTRSPISADQPLTGKPPVAAGLITPELRVLTAEEVASVLRVDLDLVTRSITSGELPGNRIGGHWRIDQGALMQWLQGSYEAPLRKDPVADAE